MTRHTGLFFTLFSFAFLTASAQFAPAAGNPGSTAIAGDSSCFVSWAKRIQFVPGWKDISHPDSGVVSDKNTSSALGPSKSNGVLSLGDSGSATLGFSLPIMNGPGWDFAVFENSFLDSFLEFAFVEVSSDSHHFVRFPAISNSDTSKQTGAFGFTRPEHINNLAGKYVVGYGTPFDLEELKDSANIDINNIVLVRVVDVVGSINPRYGTRDSRGHIVNDPWPTLFPSSGFDLDAVGVIHENTTARVNAIQTEPVISVKPNPVFQGDLNLIAREKGSCELYSVSGKLMFQFSVSEGENQIYLPMPSGMYYLRFGNSANNLKLMLVD